MTDIEKEDVTDFASELASSTVVSDNAWEKILAFVNQVSLTTLDTDADRVLARIYLAAHIGKTTAAGSSAAAGPVTSESVGGIRRSYGLVASTTSSALSTTRYGQLYLELLAMCLTNGPIVI